MRRQHAARLLRGSPEHSARELGRLVRKPSGRGPSARSSGLGFPLAPRRHRGHEIQPVFQRIGADHAVREPRPGEDQPRAVLRGVAHAQRVLREAGDAQPVQSRTQHGAFGFKDAVGAAAEAEGDPRELSRTALARVVQLTGFSDPLYAEAYVTVHQYDIVLDVAITNRTEQVLQNVTLELATLGDLRLVERPAPATLAPGARVDVTTNIKVSSTETGAIFGNLVFERGGTGEADVVVLADVHIDVMDYIAPAACSDAEFRAMWAEFEWENKVAVSTAIDDVRAYVDHVVAATNMRCLAPLAALDGDCDVLAANLYARSVFGEDALVNVSVEKLPDGKLGGFIRIRSKTQGIALSLGDKLILKQKG
ncbi:coatomer beta [Helicosporidium sp. ATCC 50920]|nr:coatomer beta [Helicosporidium sp. ATCC 50920]|eukprot:KDD76953.1 coatomer beta [Helicosporidium sp. ATCC 50920]